MMRTILTLLLVATSFPARARDVSREQVLHNAGESQYTSMFGMYYVQDQFTGYQFGVSDPALRSKLEEEAEAAFEILKKAHGVKIIFVNMGVGGIETKASFERRYAGMIDRLRRWRSSAQNREVVVQLHAGGLWNWQVYSYANIVNSSAVRGDYLRNVIYPVVDALSGVASGLTILEETGMQYGSDSQTRIPLETAACLQDGTVMKACRPDLTAECGDIAGYDFAAIRAQNDCLMRPDNGGPESCVSRMRGRTSIEDGTGIKRPPEKEVLECLQKCVSETKASVGLEKACAAAGLRNGLDYVDHVGAAPFWLMDTDVFWRNDRLRMCNLKRWEAPMRQYASSVRATTGVGENAAINDWIQGRVIIEFERLMAEEVSKRSRGVLPYYLWSNCFATNCLPAMEKAGGIISSIYGYGNMYRYVSFLKLLLDHSDTFKTKKLYMFAGSPRSDAGDYVADPGQRQSFLALGLALNVHGLGFFDMPLSIVNRAKAGSNGAPSRLAEDDALFKRVNMISVQGRRFPNKVLVVTDDIGDWNSDFFSVSAFKSYDTAPQHALRALFPDVQSLKKYKMIVLYAPGDKPNCVRTGPVLAWSALCGVDDAVLDRYVQEGGLLAVVGPVSLNPSRSTYLGGQILRALPSAQPDSALMKIEPGTDNAVWQAKMGMPARRYETLLRPWDVNITGTPVPEVLSARDAGGTKRTVGVHLSRGAGGVLVVTADRPRRGGSECNGAAFPDCGGINEPVAIARQYSNWQNFVRDMLFAFANAHRPAGTAPADNWYSATIIPERVDPNQPPLVRYHKNVVIAPGWYPLDGSREALASPNGRFLLREFVVYPDSACGNFLKPSACPSRAPSDYGFGVQATPQPFDEPWEYFTSGRVRRFEPGMGGANFVRSFYYNGGEEAKFGRSFAVWLSNRAN